MSAWQRIPALFVAFAALLCSGVGHVPRAFDLRGVFLGIPPKSPRLIIYPRTVSRGKRWRLIAGAPF